MVQRTKYGFPTRAPRKRASRSEIFRPTLGLHAGDVPQDLQPGLTPSSRNWVTDSGYLTPRSGLSQFQGFSFEQPVLGGGQLFDINGEDAAVASSASSIGFIHASSNSWSFLSYVQGSVVSLGAGDTPSGLSTDYWSTTPIYDAENDRIIAVQSNATNWMKFFEVADGTTTYSDFTWTDSLVSTKAAKAISAVNDRLLLFNTVDASGTKFPTRVMWSARGNPLDFTLAGGAGFEDIMSMKGEGLAAESHRENILLFTDAEIWVARPTLDDYAFRFDRVTDKVGCPFPKTAAATPLGVMFLSRDLEVYATDGAQVIPVGPAGQGEPSRIQSYLRDRLTEGSRAWATYNPVDRRYELYFTTNRSSEGYPVEALYYHIDDRSWLPQRFEHELSFGFDFDDPGALVTWGSLGGLTWDDMQQGWGSVGAGEDARFVTIFGSGGTAYRLRSDQSNDDGTDIDARWQSHGMTLGDEMRQTHLTEVWIDYKATSDSSATVHTSNDLGASFDAGTGANLSAAGRNVFVPVWTTGAAPVFEVRVTDGSQPKLARFQATLRDAGRFSG